MNIKLRFIYAGLRKPYLHTQKAYLVNLDKTDQLNPSHISYLTNGTLALNCKICEQCYAGTAI